jgi:hypothetical protein
VILSSPPSVETPVLDQAVGELPLHQQLELLLLRTFLLHISIIAVADFGYSGMEEWRVSLRRGEGDKRESSGTTNAICSCSSECGTSSLAEAITVVESTPIATARHRESLLDSVMRWRDWG